MCVCVCALGVRFRDISRPAIGDEVRAIARFFRTMETFTRISLFLSIYHLSIYSFFFYSLYRIRRSPMTRSHRYTRNQIDTFERYEIMNNFLENIFRKGDNLDEISVDVFRLISLPHHLPCNFHPI